MDKKDAKNPQIPNYLERDIHALQVKKLEY